MGKYTRKLAKTAAPILRPGETLVAAVRAMSWGFTKDLAIGDRGGLVSSFVASKLIDTAGASPDPDQLEKAGLPRLPPQLAIGLTEQRLLIFERSMMSGKAKDLVAELPRERIAGLSGVPSSSKVRPDHLIVHLDDDLTVWFEVVRLDGVETLVDAFS